MPAAAAGRSSLLTAAGSSLSICYNQKYKSMNTKTLSQSVNELPKEQQAVVLDFVETLLATHKPDAAEKLSSEQKAMIEQRLKEPFEPADPAEVDAFFARHGI